MSQENEEEDKVEVGGGAEEEGWNTPAESSKELWDIVKVSRNSPPSRYQ